MKAAEFCQPLDPHSLVHTKAIHHVFASPLLEDLRFRSLNTLHKIKVFH